MYFQSAHQSQVWFTNLRFYPRLSRAPFLCSSPPPESLSLPAAPPPSPLSLTHPPLAGLMMEPRGLFHSVVQQYKTYMEIGLIEITWVSIFYALYNIFLICRLCNVERCWISLWSSLHKEICVPCGWSLTIPLPLSNTVETLWTTRSVCSPKHHSPLQSSWQARDAPVRQNNSAILQWKTGLRVGH